jgi:hypothetical protein
LKSATIAGLVLVVLGALALVYQGVTYTSHKKVLDIGPLQATTEQKHTVPLPPILGALAVAGGLALMFSGARRV